MINTLLSLKFIRFNKTTFCKLLILFQWVDGKKPIFTVDIIPATTLHALDRYLDMFLSLTATLQLGHNLSNESLGTDGGSRFYRDSTMGGQLLQRLVN